MRKAYVIAARRTTVEPKGGLHKDREAHELWAPVAQAALADASLHAGDVEDVALGNGLYGSGNPARLCALAAGIGADVPAITLDSQCCSGLDSVLYASAVIGIGQADVVVCGGVESFSQRPLRARVRSDGQADYYLRPPFTPWPDVDPDMIEAAVDLARARQISCDRQIDWAVRSHEDARAVDDEMRAQEFVLLQGQEALKDGFTRKLSAKLAARAKVLAEDGAYRETAVTTAVEADAAAALIVVSEDVLQRLSPDYALEIVAGRRGGDDPALPGLAPIAPTRKLLARTGLAADAFARIEIMEAFAAQAIACADAFEFDRARINYGGGALARGHPIGASGAILAVRLFAELQQQGQGAVGLAMIAAAGGLGSAAVFRKVGL